VTSARPARGTNMPQASGRNDAGKQQVDAVLGEDRDRAARRVLQLPDGQAERDDRHQGEAHAADAPRRALRWRAREQRIEIRGERG